MPVNEPKTCSAGFTIPGVRIALGRNVGHCGTVQHCGSFGSVTKVHLAGTASYLLHLKNHIQFRGEDENVKVFKWMDDRFHVKTKAQMAFNLR